MARKKRSENLNNLIKLLDSNPELADRLVESLTAPPKQPTNDMSQVPPANMPSLSDVTSGRVELNKGRTVKNLYEGISVCAMCGKEQKTYSENAKGQVTQYVCHICANKMSLMSPRERDEFMEKQLANNYIEVAQARFNVLQRRFEKKRKEEEKNYGKYGRSPIDSFQVNPNKDKDKK